MSCLLQPLHQWTQRAKEVPPKTSFPSLAEFYISDQRTKVHSPGDRLQKQQGLIIQNTQPMSTRAAVICKRCIIRRKYFLPSAAQSLSISSTRSVMTNMIIISLNSMFGCLLARKKTFYSLAWLGNYIFFKETPTIAEVFRCILCGELGCFYLPWCWSGIFIVWCPRNERASVLLPGAPCSELSLLICRWQW